MKSVFALTLAFAMFLAACGGAVGSDATGNPAEVEPTAVEAQSPVESAANDDWEEIYVERLVENYSFYTPSGKTVVCFGQAMETDQDMRSGFEAAPLDDTTFSRLMGELGIEMTQQRIDRGFDVAVEANRLACDGINSMSWEEIWRAVRVLDFESKQAAEQLQTCTSVDQYTDDQIRASLVASLVRDGDAGVDTAMLQIFDHYGIAQTRDTLDHGIDIAIETLHQVCE